MRSKEITNRYVKQIVINDAKTKQQEIEKDMVAFFHLILTVYPFVSFVLLPFSEPKIEIKGG